MTRIIGITARWYMYVPIIVYVFVYSLPCLHGCRTNKQQDNSADSLKVGKDAPKEMSAHQSDSSRLITKALWKNLNGPYSDDILSVLVLNNGFILAGTNLNGIFISKDHGATWSRSLSTPWRVLSLKCNINGTIVAKLGYNPSPCIFSSDQGDSWLTVHRGTDSIWISSFISESGTLIVQDQKGEMYHTDDCGRLWSKIKLPDGVGNIHNMGFGRDKKAITITDRRKILYSEDDGCSWSKLGTEYPYAVQAVHILDNGEFFVIMGNGGIYRSNDQGATWTASGKENLSELFVNLGESHLLVTSKNRGLLESFDYGKSFSSLGMTNTYITSLTFDPDSNLIVGTYGRGVFRLNRTSKQWAQLTTGWSLADVKSIAFETNNTIYVGTSSFGIYRSLNAGQTWTNVSLNLEDLDITSIVVGRRKDIYAVSWTGFIFQSTDQGDHWTCLNQGGPSFGNIDATSLVVDSAGNIYAGCLDEGVRKLSVNDKKLISLSDKYYRAEKLCYEASTNSFYCIFVEFKPISTDLHSGDKRLGTLHYSIDSCRSWKALCPRVNDVECISIDKAGTIVIGTEQSGVLRSIDQGKNWQKLGFDDVSIAAVFICDSTTIVIGTTRNDIYASINLGKNWMRINSGIPLQASINFVSLDQRAYLYVGAWSAGLYRSIEAYPKLLRPIE